VRLEELGKLKYPITLSGIEPAMFQLVASIQSVFNTKPGGAYNNHCAWNG
jgi:hypothetical protein